MSQSSPLSLDPVRTGVTVGFDPLEVVRGRLPALERTVPPRALGISVLALAVAVVGSLIWPESLGLYASLVWVLALVPCFMLSYYRGWTGAALGLAIGMAALILLHTLSVLIAGQDVDWRISGSLTVALIAVGGGIGTVSELLRREKERALELAFVDLLTQLPNRLVLHACLDKLFACARRGQHLSIVVIDVDSFKDFNKRHGRREGDEALQAVADIVRRNTRRSDISGRYGDDSFMALLPNEDVAGARSFAERVRESVTLATSRTEPPHEAPETRPMTVSLGVAGYDLAMSGVDDLIEAAHKALYRAKIGMGNRVESATKADFGPFSRTMGSPR